jgi:lipopolysaccharide/colanic/teichoic acid biosynthesis glycosyltransferase
MHLSNGGYSEANDFADTMYKKHAGDRYELRSGKLDSGLWLLQDIFARHDSWKRLGSLPQGTFSCLNYLSTRRYRVIKRSCDVVGSLVFLTMLLPLGIMLAILIKFDSSGPVFFRHRRIGRNGKYFVLWKFRSMRTDVAKYGISPQTTADERLTRIGRLIRRLSIDELPQLINVLRGEMSLVGPRPEMPFIVDGYRPFERERLSAKPGLTGLWQISPARAFPIHENLQYDFHYINNQNLLLDSAIILRTLAAVIRGIGAV